MNEVKKMVIKPKTLGDGLVGICLAEVRMLPASYCVVGGIATQSYIPWNYRRPTSDIDLLVPKALNYEEFRKMISPIASYFQDNGYAVATKKMSRAYAMELTDKNGESIIVEVARRNEKNFEKHQKRLERELKNARKKIIEGKNLTYFVAAPEDIILPKLVRCIGSLKRDSGLSKLVPMELKGVSAEDAERRLRYINSLREEATYSPADAVLAERLRFVSDLYDMRVLSEIAGLNPDYFKTASEDWDTIKDNTKERETIFSHILPDMGGL
jgi:hypothetical protein